MKRVLAFPVLASVCLFALASAHAQETKPQAEAPESPAVAASAAPAANPLVTVPRLIKFSGTLEDMAAKPITGVAEVTFAIYREQAGGDPLWFETQRVEADALGRYTVLLGAMSPQGLPAELFTSTAAHWLGVQVGNLPESAQGGRILLVSVPYALKALDAETLGGKPASAFQLVAPESAVTATGPASKSGSGSANLKTPTGKGPTPQVTSGTAGCIAKFINSSDLGCSELFDTGTAIGLGTTTPAATLDIVASNSGVRLRGSGTHQIQVTGATSGRLGQDSSGFFFASDTNGAAVRFLTNNGTLHEWMRITSAGNVGIGTIAPANTLEVKGATTGLAATVSSAGGIAAIFDNTAGGKVLSARNNGVEKLSVDGGGNVVTGGTLAGTQLISTVAMGTPPLAITSTTVVPNLNADLVDGFHASAFAPAGVYATLGTNTFTGAQTISSGNVSISAGNLDLPQTLGAAAGVIALGGEPFIHACCGNANDNIYVGRFAGNFTGGGAGNTVIGAGALASDTTGSNNTASGASALGANTTGDNNTASGVDALISNTSGNFNTASGDAALAGNTTGSDNTAAGTDALSRNDTGNLDAAFGICALLNTRGTSFSPSPCTLPAPTAGSGNTGLGATAGQANVTGELNTFVGYKADAASGTLTNATAIGANALVGESNALVLGSINGLNGATASVKVGIGTTTPTTTLQVAGGDVSTMTAGTGLIVKSPDGTKCARIGIDNSGAIVATSVGCP